MNRRTLLKTGVATALAAVVPLSRPRLAAAAPHQQTTKIKIVSSLSGMGSSPGQTQAMVNSIKLAIEDAGGRAGAFDVEYESLDGNMPSAGAWDPGIEAENARKSSADPNVVVYIGTYHSDAARVSIPILNAARLAMISPANSYPGLTKATGAEPNEPNVYYPNGTRNYCRVCPTDDIQGAVGAAWAQSLGATSVYVLDDTERVGHGVAVAFAQEAARLGLEILGGPEGVDAKAARYLALAVKIRAVGPDLVYFGGAARNGAGKLLKDLRAVGVEAPFMGGGGLLEEAFIRDAGPAAEGALVTSGGVPAASLTGAGAEWYAAYKRKFGGGEPSAHAAYSYEATKLAIDAIQRAGSKDREAIRAAVFATRNFGGILGAPWSFDTNGDTSLTGMGGYAVKNGEWEFVGRLAAR